MIPRESTETARATFVVVAEVEDERLDVAVEDQADDLIVAVDDRAARIAADDVGRRDEVERRVELEAAGLAGRDARTGGSSYGVSLPCAFACSKAPPIVVNGGIDLPSTRSPSPSRRPAAG